MPRHLISLEQGVLIPLAIAGVWYAAGLLAITRRGFPVRKRKALLFAAGWLFLFVALASPLDAISDQLFSAHMVQHELLMTVAAPLLVLARPTAVLLSALPGGARRAVVGIACSRGVRRSWRTLGRPMHAWLVHGIAIWVWHAPVLFDAALENDAVHAAQHLCFLGSAMVFWWSLVYGQRRASRGMSILYLFTTAVHTGVLGALLSVSRHAWYAAYADRAVAWGLSSLADQQLAGLIMWVPASLAYLLAALLLFARWLRESEWSVERGERAALVAQSR